MKTNSPENKVVVITGGSSGIGYALAENLLAKDAIVCLVARDEARLQTAARALEQTKPGSTVQYYPCDVSDYETVKSTVQQIADANQRIDWLINNAGAGEPGRFESQPLSSMHRVMDINYWGPVHLTLLALPWLRKSQGAALAFVSSVAGYVGLFGYTNYTGSKFALGGLAECLRMEFADYDIPVTIVYPPDTDTPMHDREKALTLPECRSLSETAKLVSAAAVADALVSAMIKRQFEVYLNFESRLVRFLRGVAPGFLWKSVDATVRKGREKGGYRS